MSPNPSSRRGSATLLLAAALSGCASPRPAPARPGGAAPIADLVLTGGPILTGDPARPLARALAVRDGRVVATGSEAEVASLAGPRTEVVRLKERAVVPGFVDARACLAREAWPAHRVTVRAPEKARLLARLVAEAGVRPHLPLVVEGWVPATLLGVRQDLDAAVPGRPVLVFSLDGDVAWLSSAAIAWLGLEKETAANPVDGAPRGPDGAYRGVFRGRAWMRLVLDRAFEASDPAGRAVALDSALARLAAAGVTSLHDRTVSVGLIRALRERAGAGTLPVRVRAWPRAGDADRVTAAREEGPRPDLFRLGGVTKELDLGPASGGAASRIARAGPVLGDDFERRRLVSDLQQDGVRIAFDASGSLAVKAALDALESTSPLPWAMRARLEGADVVESPEADRLSRLNVVLSLQPARAGLVTSGVLDRSLVPALELWTLASHARKGVTVALGSGGLASTPLETIAAAMRGPSPKEAMTLEEALAAHTHGGAVAAWEEDELGTLAPGKRADLVVLSGDPRGLAADRVERLRVERTLVGGRWTWRGDGTKAAGGPR